MTTISYVPSRYLILGKSVFVHPSGARVRAVYHAGRATLLLLDTNTIASLGEGAVDLDVQAQLIAQGVLVPRGTDEAAEVIASSRKYVQDSRTRQFVIMPTSYCNMGCEYCGQEHSRGSAPIGGGQHRTALAARIIHAISSGAYDAIKVSWFGGEPLMAYAVIRSLSQQFVAASRIRKVSYSGIMATNGALLDARKLRSLYLECSVTELQITVDGPPGTHNASRILKSGQPSYPRIIAALQAALADPDLDGLRLTVRTNVGQHNAHQAADFAAAMRDAGVAGTRVLFYLAPIHSWGNDVSQHALNLADMAEVELEWFEQYIRHGLTSMPIPRAVKPVVCAAVTPHTEVNAPDGRIYSCTEQPLVPGFTEKHVATVDSLGAGELRPLGEFDDWHDELASQGGEGCSGCRILPICGGACPKLWREGKPPCPPLKLNIEQRIDMQAALLGLTPIEQ